MSTTYEFPLRAEAQLIQIQLGEVEYRVRFGWGDTSDGGWFIDIADAEGTPILRGLPLTAGEDVLQQFNYLGIGGKIRVQSDGDGLIEPTYANLGSNGKVLFITP